jgi:hypothetical protein
MEQQRAWLLGGDGIGALPAVESLQLAQSLLAMLVWAAKYSHSSLCDQIAMFFSSQLPHNQHADFSVLAGVQVWFLVCLTTCRTSPGVLI